MQKKNRVNILGVPVDMVDKEQASAVFAEIFSQPGCSMIVTPNSEIVQNASKDEELRSLIASADLIIPDGIGLVYASKVMGCPLSERVTGIDFLEYHRPSGADRRIGSFSSEASRAWPTKRRTG